MNFLQLLLHRIMTVGGVRYRGTFFSGGHFRRVYSRYPIVEQTKETLEFEGGMKLELGQPGRTSGGRYGKIVTLRVGSDSNLRFTAMDCGRR
ncbi:MAG TPA: hypothetical protein VD907_01180 [Verrucomicrobiae bacterium]|nr:hypothetical protein [Verrucomicrobiae bacterium]